MEVEVITTYQIQEFERLLSTNPEMKKFARKVLSSVLQKARSELAKDLKSQIDYDPRAAYRAAKRTVYKRLLGGSLSILNSRRASSTRVSVQHTRLLDLNPHQRGGNRRQRSERTELLDSYYGKDRGFVLRFLNAGTDNRESKYGRRGRITPRNIFKDPSHKHMEAAAKRFCELIDEEIERINKETNK